MAKKKKINTISSRNKAKIKTACSQFDRSMLAWTAVVVVCSAAAAFGSYNLSGKSVCGFFCWYLAVWSCIPLVTVRAFCGIFEIGWDFANREYLLLIAGSAVTLAAVWVGVRLSCMNGGVRLVRAARWFVWLFAIWGVFQICCALILRIGENGIF